MWMATKIGFYSIVETKNNHIQIRARCKQDLENLQNAWDVDTRLEMWKIIKTVRADYRYRIVIPRRIFEEHWGRFVDMITYGNFKDAVGKTNKRREQLYHQVWWLLRQIEAEDEGEDE